MSVTIIVGSQWGDEGKGKITDLLTEQYDIIVRYQGGCNAGHTVVVGDKQYIFHLLPSGILHEDKICLIGNGVVLDPEVFFEEIDSLEKEGISIENRLYIDYKTHVILPYHKIMDEISEKEKGNMKIGTTKKGIGPAYVDKYSRNGIRVCDLIHEDSLEEKLVFQLEQKKEFLLKNYKFELSRKSISEIKDKYHEYGKKIKKYIIDGSYFLDDNIKKDKNIIFEGAQGIMLDVDHGTYPYVTSSNPMAGCACTGSGISPIYIDNVIGICKAYTTRVGEGPFPTELIDLVGEKMREYGNEYGATTGRPRRCGWFDAPVVKYANRINGIKEIVLTKLDVLSKFEKIKICKEYNINKEIYSYYPADSEIIKYIEPVYEEIEGWQEDISQIKIFNDLPDKARKYIRVIERLTDCKVSIVSVGAKRSQTIIR
jgi:adenylosuccinate synthase